MTTIKITGMSCQHCVNSVTSALENLEGVSQVQVDLEHGEARFEGTVDEQKVKEAIAAIGFEVG